ncbi:pentatricopeptide repeat-containing protein At5g59600-like [Argentina anserina]|uniref:pentatricopeptide repeat-containing protein At5g59600-like n=1 Tax=Argentina anserina TaxID=57926 RepID=UPI00217622F2|nr:pentatricopeptide repeat-containing protein At5g59600-like [Potentilla anserina]XP_050370500.1 pentatricopeptide repeat-containing protein At5g59600-like [Potentilla anserina]
MNVFCEMQRQGCRPNRIVIPSVLKACGHLSDVKTGKKLHAVVLRHSFEFDAFISSAIIDMYSKNGRVEKARWVFDMMVEKDLVALNAVVSGFCQRGMAEEALVLVEEMQVVGIKPNLITWNSLVAGFSQKGDEAMASRLFELMCINGIEPDVVSWTSVISGFVKNFQNSKVFCTFKKMLNHGICPTSATISGLLPACASVTNLRCGKELYAYALVVGVEADVYVRSALVDMYAKCGFIY